MTAYMPDQYLPPEEAARFIGRRPRTLKNWRARRIGPAYHRTSQNTVTYKVSDLAAWMDQHRHTAEA